MCEISERNKNNEGEREMDTIHKLNNFYSEKLSILEVTKYLTSYDEQIDGFVIYGCGPLGNYLKDVMQQLSLNLLGYVDDFYDGSQWDNVEVYSLQEVLSKFKHVSIILTPHYENNKRMMKEKIEKAVNGEGAYDILDKNVLLYVAHGFSLDKEKKQVGNIYEKTDLIISNCCTLRCEGCSVCIPYVEKEHFDLEEVKRDISKLNDLVDYIAVLEVMGGEPLLYPWLPQLLDYISGLSNIYVIMIDTNGTVVPNEEMLDAMARNHVLIHVTDYGEVSTKKDVVLEKCEEKNIYCTIREVGEWADLGKIKDYETTENDKKFHSCFAAVECANVYRGRWHICPRDAKYVDMNLFSPCEDEFINLHDDMPETEKRQKLYDLTHRENAITSCRFCKGTDGKIQGGVQMVDAEKNI